MRGIAFLTPGSASWKDIMIALVVDAIDASMFDSTESNAASLFDSIDAWLS